MFINPRIVLLLLRTAPVKQENLANAKATARQPWYIGRNSLNRPPLRIARQYQRNLYIVEKYFENLNLQQFKQWRF